MCLNDSVRVSRDLVAPDFPFWEVWLDRSQIEAEYADWHIFSVAVKFRAFNDEQFSVFDAFASNPVAASRKGMRRLAQEVVATATNGAFKEYSALIGFHVADVVDGNVIIWFSFAIAPFTRIQTSRFSNVAFNPFDKVSFSARVFNEKATVSVDDIMSAPFWREKPACFVGFGGFDAHDWLHYIVGADKHMSLGAQRFHTRCLLADPVFVARVFDGFRASDPEKRSTFARLQVASNDLDAALNEFRLVAASLAGSMHYTKLCEAVDAVSGVHV